MPEIKKEIQQFVEFNMKMAEIRQKGKTHKSRESFASALIRHLPLKVKGKLISRKIKKNA